MGDTQRTWYLPEHTTHLYYSPLYAALTPKQKQAYNRLHACYHCEMCALFEVQLPKYYLQAVAAEYIPHRLRTEAQALAESEKWHASAFLALARQLSPDLYADREAVFVQPPSTLSRIFRKLFDCSALRPTLLWIALIQEERGAFFGEEVLRHADELDPRMVSWQRKHLADESDHISLGEALLPLCWDASSPVIRRMNSLLLRFVLREFLCAPKRSGRRVVECLVEECPELMPRKTELGHALHALDRNPAFHSSVYSRQIVPKTFALFDRYTEFHDLGKGLWGYSREVHP